MKKYFKEVVLDFSGGASSQRIVAKQGDKKSRIIKINPILNGQQLIIDEGCTIDFRCIKPDKKIVIAEATKESDGKITVELPEQSLAVVGDVKCDIAINGNQGEILSSSNFILEVRTSPDIEDYIPSKDYFKRESDIDMDNHSITNLAAPTANYHAVNKAYVDGSIQNIPQISVDSEMSDTSENPVQNKVVAKAIYDVKPTLITFNNADFENTDTQQFPIGISFVLSHNHIMLMATFDVSRLNFSIPEGAEFSIHKVLIEDEPFDLSLLDDYIKEMELFSSDYGEGWLIDGDLYMYLHEYNFSTTENAQTAFDDLQESINLTGFQLLVNSYNQITATEV